MSQKQRVKGYWLKKTETYQDSAKAKTRAAELRQNDHTSHVLLEQDREQWKVNYSVAKWYVEEMKAAGVKL